jgi:hypothetical protein
VLPQFFVAIFLWKHFRVLFTCCTGRFQTICIVVCVREPHCKINDQVQSSRTVSEMFFFLTVLENPVLNCYTPTSCHGILVDFVSNQKWHKVHHVLFLLVSTNVQSVPSLFLQLSEIPLSRSNSATSIKFSFWYYRRQTK